MSRILAVDYGRRRCGIAVSDPMRLIAGGLPTVSTRDLTSFLQDYCRHNAVSEIVVGLPRRLSGEYSECMRYIRPFMERLPVLLPDVRITMYDERFTSTLAHRAMVEAGLPRSTRRDRGLADKTAAVILLTDYLEARRLRENRPSSGEE